MEAVVVWCRNQKIFTTLFTHFNGGLRYSIGLLRLRRGRHGLLWFSLQANTISTSHHLNWSIVPTPSLLQLGHCPTTIFAFLTAQNCHLNAQGNLWCAQMVVLSGLVYAVHIQWVMKMGGEKDNKCGREKAPFRGKRTPFIMQKDSFYPAKGLLLCL